MILQPWELCDIRYYVSISSIRFVRRVNTNLPFNLFDASGYEIIILYNEQFEYWFADSMIFGIYNPLNPLYGMSELDKKGKTPEVVMFKVDLFLLDNGRFTVEEPFIFPMNDL